MHSQNINYQGYGTFKIFTPNEILEFRANSFATKEPTTLEWMQSLEKDSILIDVGANIGIYTIPSAMYHVKKVIAIEPEIKNYNMLLDNLKLNNIDSNKVEALPLGVSTEYQNQITKIYLTSDITGASCHQVGRNQNHLLQATNNNKRITKSIYCVSLSSIVKQIGTYHDGPIHIKIDVDGIEEDVCQSLFEEKTISRIATLQIELNSSMKSHAELINQLSKAGFGYSENQVSKSLRKSGDFKGFAEIVFRRKVSLRALNSLPKAYAKFLGNNYIPLSESKNDFPEHEYISLNNATLVPANKLPFTFVLKNSFNSTSCSKLFHKVATEVLKTDVQSINFPSQSIGSIQQIDRCVITNQIIEELSTSYVSNLHSQAQSNNFIARVLYSYQRALEYNFDSDYVAKNFPRRGSTTGHRFVCRIRHFLDLYGYSLDRHNDSPDTICAFIMPIFEHSTTTCLIGSPFNDRELIGKPCNNLNLRKSEFKNVYYNSDSHKKQLNHYTNIENKFSYKESFKYESISLKAGESLLIPNMTSGLIGGENAVEYASSITGQLHKMSGHGVLPFVQEAYRPVLLIDYLLIKGKHIERGLVRTTNDTEIIDLGPAEKYFPSQDK